jgi:hypothetical protein
MRRFHEQLKGRVYIDCTAYYDLHDTLDLDYDLVLPSESEHAKKRRMLNLRTRHPHLAIESLGIEPPDPRYVPAVYGYRPRPIDQKPPEDGRNTLWARYNKIELKTTSNGAVVELEAPPPDSYLLCPAFLKGFLFSTRSWGMSGSGRMDSRS